MHSADEIKKRLARRAKRKREKLRAKDAGDGAAAADDVVVEVSEELEDTFYPVGALKLGAKIRYLS